ncbi:hypothetical protein [Bradyrhizobium sp. SZCCHNRI1009]|uniref:hypothetical protein n=1 Tax=Bradyrhizobium sp. SZCCHNRI1009 TaxID=3057277 RepID=UPI002916E1D6|nr:hypothetical protein [Bradyrhizobium sp. SZCCHNRI1009]
MSEHAAILPPIRPPFVRIGWVSEAARKVWEPRFELIRTEWKVLRWRAVAAGLSRASISTVNPEALDEMALQVERAGLALIPVRLAVEAVPKLPSSQTRARLPLEVTIAVVRARDTDEFEADWQRDPARTLRDWAGCPHCCAEALRRRERRPLDPVWASALFERTEASGHRRIELPSRPATNMLWRSIDLCIIPHWPCRLDCPASAALAANMLAFGRAHCGQTTEWLFDVLTWPAEWSMMHGIAELHAPVCRITASTSYSSARREIIYHGATWPVEGASGLRFPYRAPSRERWTGSKSFRGGTLTTG